MKSKVLSVSVLSACMALTVSSSVLASTWHSDKNGSWHENSDGVVAYNTWRWIDKRPTDSVGDGISWCYYFDSNGYMLKNATTPDGFWVNADGAWVHGGNIQETNINAEVGGQTPTPQSNWKRDSYGFWYQNPDGSYPVNEWKWIDMRWHDTVSDGIAWCYYFDSRGYVLSNTNAPDGSNINDEGAWTVNGVAQYRSVN